MRYFSVVCLLFCFTGCTGLQEWRASGGLLGKMGYESAEQKLSKSWAGHSTDELIARWGQPTSVYQKDGFTVLQYKKVKTETTQYESPQYGFSQRTTVSECTRGVFTKNKTISHIYSSGNSC